METEDYPAWQDEFRVAIKRDELKFVVGKVKHFSQYQLYNKIRQLDEWSETLDSRQAKHARRMKALGLSFEHPRESVLSNYGTYHAESDATKDKEVEKKETTAESEDGEAEKPSEEGLGGS